MTPEVTHGTGLLSSLQRDGIVKITLSWDEMQQDMEAMLRGLEASQRTNGTFHQTNTTYKNREEDDRHPTPHPPPLPAERKKTKPSSSRSEMIPMDAFSDSWTECNGRWLNPYVHIC